MTETITLKCQACGRTMDYDRKADPAIPRKVVKIVQSRCDRCWHGDFDDETWYDAKGLEVLQRR